MKYERILKAIEETVWMIHPPKLEEIIGVIEARASGVSLSVEHLEAFEARKRKFSGVQGKVAVLPLFGTISQRFNFLTASGGTSTEEFGREFDEALRNPDVGAIVLDVDSPGGSVYGVPELGDKIFAARGTKSIVAVANSAAFSAAYWIATAAEHVVVTPSGEVGSVGVLATHLDYSKFNETMGVKPTYIHAGKYKVEGNFDEPLGDEARAEIQRHVDRYYDMFVEGLARNRSTTARTVRNDFGQGRVFGPEEAVRRGMADRVATLSQVVSELAAPKSKGRNASLLRKRLDLLKSS